MLSLFQFLQGWTKEKGNKHKCRLTELWTEFEPLVFCTNFKNNISVHPKYKNNKKMKRRKQRRTIHMSADALKLENNIECQGLLITTNIFKRTATYDIDH